MTAVTRYRPSFDPSEAPVIATTSFAARTVDPVASVLVKVGLLTPALPATKVVTVEAVKPEVRLMLTVKPPVAGGVVVFPKARSRNWSEMITSTAPRETMSPATVRAPPTEASPVTESELRVASPLW